MFGRGAEAVQIHPGGMHVKHFDMCGWLASARFEFVRRRQAEYRSKVGDGAIRAAGSADWTG